MCQDQGWPGFRRDNTHVVKDSSRSGPKQVGFHAGRGSGGGEFRVVGVQVGRVSCGSGFMWVGFYVDRGQVSWILCVGFTLNWTKYTPGFIIVK
jgi:hypothetical protein